jgi:hypothetical protein
VTDSGVGSDSLGPVHHSITWQKLIFTDSS